MPLSPGSRIGPYEVIAQIGAGGMGEVYRARDTQLQRDVALKILRDAFATDPDRLSRFEREAQLLAALNHPHIAQIYGLERSGGERTLVMEYVEGETLDDRVHRTRDAGGMSPDEAAVLARQIAEGLEAAHEHGVIHRDLKPANIKIRPDGTVKILDFGLAKAFELHRSLHLSTTPTITSPALTAAGVVLGTAAYMSPEQVRGAIVDRRADIWAFGCVLFEMLTGARLFDAATVTDTFADVLRKEIDWARLPGSTPPTMVALVRRCLVRDAKARLRDIGDARLALEEHLAAPAAATHVDVNRTVSAPVGAWALAAGALTIAALGVALWATRSRAAVASTQPVHLSAELGDDLRLSADAGAGPNAVISPDGTLLAFAARKDATSPSQLYVRRLDQLRTRALDGTSGAVNPFFSPDGRVLGFFANGKLSIVPVSGGGVTPMADTGGDRGGWFASDGSIVYAPDSAPGVTIMRVRAGERPQTVTKLADGEVTHRWPQVLPGGQSVLFTAHSQTGAYDQANLVVSSLSDPNQRKIVYRGGYHGRYLPTGHIAFINKGTLSVVPFDVAKLEVTGSPSTVIESVTSDVTSASAEFSVSERGTIVYSRGPNVVTDVTIAWLDESGATSPLRAAPGDYFNPRFSPDGTRLALEIGTSWGQNAVWTLDIRRETLTRVTQGGLDQTPIWSPDGTRLAFSGIRGSDRFSSLFWQVADGSAEPRRLTSSRSYQTPASWHPNGIQLAFFGDKEGQQTDFDIGLVSNGGDRERESAIGEPRYVLADPFVEVEPEFSPDGKWLAYTSLESGRAEVFVRSFPDMQRKVQVSTAGGFSPTWSKARSELFYGTDDQRIMVASYRVDNAAFVPEKPRLWRDEPMSFAARGYTRSFDLHPDGRRFAVLKGPPPPVRTHVAVMSNFFDEVRRAAGDKTPR